MLKMLTKKGEKGDETNKKLHHCSVCDYYTCDKYKLTRHLMTPKHLKLSNANKVLTEKGEKGGEKGEQDINKLCYCKQYDHTTCNKYTENKDLITPKHIKLLNDNETIIKKPKTISIKGIFNCECGKQYKHYSSLCRHKKLCNQSTLIKKENISDDAETNYKELMVNLIHQNKELMTNLIEAVTKQSNDYQKTINEIIPKIGNNNNTINNNQKFNINVFLNENCKDAITMDNFLNSMQVSLSDLFFTREKGLTEGLTNIIIESMNKLPLTQRPMHCTDVKRETIYIKNEKWEKDENKEKIKKVLQRVSNIQIKNIHKFKDAKPNCMNNSKEKDEYMEIIKATTDDVIEREDKIIKNLCKNVYINEKIVCDMNLE